MATASLTCIGVFWTILSILSTGLSCTGFYLPMWIRGAYNNQTYFLGTFRRCISGSGQSSGFACGRYSTFNDIPTPWWQACVILIGIGCCISFIISLTALLSCCIRELVTRRAGKLAGILQICTGTMIAAGCAVYPNGWNHIEVKQICGESSSYNLGSCSLALGYYLTIAGAGLTLLTSLLSWKAGKKTDRFRNIRDMYAL